MAMATQTRRVSYLGAIAAAALTVAALTVPLSPAKADWAGVQLGPFGFGVGGPGPYYYGYRYDYPYPYYDYGYYPPYRPYYPY
jgi:hypothetical protein